ncbi:hypothetical protein MASSI9I_60282 [Massilia sp. 9I]|nr:hypothetical protein MASSI9I_60282 [Massilia sp. 9I]
MQIKMVRLCGPFLFEVFKATGLADVPPAADSLASESLRAHGPHSSAGTNALIEKKKGPTSRTLSFITGGADGARTRDPRRDRPVF